VVLGIRLTQVTTKKAYQSSIILIFNGLIKAPPAFHQGGATNYKPPFQAQQTFNAAVPSPNTYHPVPCPGTASQLPPPGRPCAVQTPLAS
jgi:hypothetical protein